MRAPDGQGGALSKSGAARHARKLSRHFRKKCKTRPMNESLRAQIETYLAHLDGLIRRGCQVRDTLTTDPSNRSAIAATRAWQEDCGVTINQLSGGSKAHWLARSFSEAFLMRSANGNAVTAVSPAELVKRTISVLEQAVASLTGMNDGRDDSGSSASSSSGSSAAP